MRPLNKLEDAAELDVTALVKALDVKAPLERSMIQTRDAFGSPTETPIRDVATTVGATSTVTPSLQAPTVVAPVRKTCDFLELRATHMERCRREGLLAATSPTLAGRRAAVWIDKWDRGSRAARLLILEAFITLHSSSNTNRIERDLGDSSMLLFTRITAWFRLSYKLGHALRPVLASIALFVRGVRYLTCLVEIGGAQALIDTLATCSISAEDRREIALLLLYIVNAGRVYREMVCDGDGVDLLLKAMQAEKETEILDLLAAMFLVLGEGNRPSIAARVHSGLIGLVLAKDVTTTEAMIQAARTLRTFQSSRDRMYTEALLRDVAEDCGTVPVVGMELNAPPDSARQLLDALSLLLFHEDLRLRVEGVGLLTLLAKNIQLTGPILTRCFDVVDEDRLAIESEENLTANLTLRRHQISFGCAAVSIILIDSDCKLRRRITFDIIARRSAHFSLLKYLRLLESEYSTSVLDCCRALQSICREALVQEKLAREGNTDVGVPLERAAHLIREVVGSTLYSVLLYEEITEDEAAFIVRSVKSSESRMETGATAAATMTTN